jgi:hypothetical protein
VTSQLDPGGSGAGEPSDPVDERVDIVSTRHEVTAKQTNHHLGTGDPSARRLVNSVEWIISKLPVLTLVSRLRER